MDKKRMAIIAAVAMVCVLLFSACGEKETVVTTVPTTSTTTVLSDVSSTDAPAGDSTMGEVTTTVSASQTVRTTSARSTAGTQPLKTTAATAKTTTAETSVSTTTTQSTEKPSFVAAVIDVYGGNVYVRVEENFSVAIKEGMALVIGVDAKTYPFLSELREGTRLRVWSGISVVMTRPLRLAQLYDLAIEEQPSNVPTIDNSTTSRIPPDWMYPQRTTRPGYTYPVIPPVFTEDMLRTDVKAEFDRTEYYVDTSVLYSSYLRIENTTDGELCLDPVRALVKKTADGGWEYVRQSADYTSSPRYLSKGKTHNCSFMIGGSQDTLTGGKLEPGEYKLIWSVDGNGWIGADFIVHETPNVPMTKENVRTDVEMTPNKVAYRVGEKGTFTIRNTTDHDVVVNLVYNFAKKTGDTWETDVQYAYYQPQVLKPGQTYEKTFSLSSKGHSFVREGDTAKLLWLVDDKWVTADFVVLTEPDSFTEQAVRTDLQLKLDKTTYVVDEQKHLSICNTTDRDVVISELYILFKKNTNGEWEQVAQNTTDNPQVVKAGETYKRAVSLKSLDAYINKNKSGKEFRIAWPVDNQWVTAEFRIELG